MIEIKHIYMKMEYVNLCNIYGNQEIFNIFLAEYLIAKLILQVLTENQIVSSDS